MAYIFPFTTLVDKKPLAVGMSSFFVHVSSAARLTEARPNAKTNTSEIVLFISLSLLKIVNIFTPHTMRTLSGLGLSLRKYLIIERHLEYLLQRSYKMRILQHNISSEDFKKKKEKKGYLRIQGF
jgi:hypothetical protein